jgi:hypothetical protein
MNARISEGSVLRTAKRILGLAGLVSLGLVCPGLVRAQSSVAPTPAPAAKPAAVTAASSGVQSPNGTPAPERAVSRNSSGGTSAPKGQHEGITVHGHWVIEVKNPNGTTTARREFENGLISGDGNGAGLLAGLLAGSTSGGLWGVALMNYTPGGELIGQDLFILSQVASCPSENTVAFLPSFSFCSTTPLSVTAPVDTSGLLTGTVVLQGSAVVPQGFVSPISFVETVKFTCGTTVAPSTCSTMFSEQYSLFTGRPLDGQNGDPISVPVTSGQTVQATVTISFSSGSSASGDSAPAVRH